MFDSDKEELSIYRNLWNPLNASGYLEYLDSYKRNRITKFWITVLSYSLAFYLGVTSVFADCIKGGFGVANLNGRSEIIKIPEAKDERQYILNADKSAWDSIPSNGFQSKMSSDGYLVRTRLCDTKSGKYYLLLNDASIHEIKVYLKPLNTDQILLVSNIQENYNITGKPISHRYYVIEFELQNNLEYELYIYSRETNGTLWTDYKLYSHVEFIKYLVNEESKVGLLIGGLLVLLITSLMFWLFTFNEIYLYYSIYLLGCLFFGATTLGLLKFYFPRYSIFLTDALAWLGSFIIIAMMLALTKSFLKLENRFPLINRLFTFLIWFYLLEYILLYSTQLIIGYVPNFILKLPHPTIAAQPPILLSCIIYYYIKTKDAKAIYLLIVFSLSIATIALMSLKPILGTPVGLFKYLRWFILLEAFIIFLIIFKSNFFELLEKLNLSVLKLDQSSEKLNALIIARRNERERISNFLHNRIGLKMGAVKLGLSENKISAKTNVSELIDEISDEIRMISHNLNPEILYEKGLIETIEQELFRLEDLYPNRLITFNYSAKKNTLSRNQNEVFYNCFLEIMQNTLKHNSAKQIMINMYSSKNEFKLEFIDNGITYNTSMISSGSGFKRILTELKTINGELKVSENDDKNGMCHIVKLKLD